MFYFHGTRKPNFKDVQNLNYDDYWKFRGFRLRGKLREREYIFIDWIKDGSSVLDLACGNSPLLLELKNKKKCLVKAIDISPTVINEQDKLGVSGFVGNFNDSDFTLDKFYDYIVLNETIEHSAQPEMVIKRIKKHSRYLMFSIPNSAFYRYRIGLMFRGRFFTQWAYHPSEHLRYWSHIDFMDWLGAMGLKIIKCQSSNGFKIGKNLWKNLLGHQICYLTKTDEN